MRLFVACDFMDQFIVFKYFRKSFLTIMLIILVTSIKTLKLLREYIIWIKTTELHKVKSGKCHLRLYMPSTCINVYFCMS